MFRKNTRHQQIPLTNHVDELPEKLRKRLENSWGVFYREIYSRIEETPFAVLYADCESQPKVAVNTLVGLEFLKADNGWTDEEHCDNFSYDIHYFFECLIQQIDALFLHIPAERRRSRATFTAHGRVHVKIDRRTQTWLRQ